MNEPVAWMDEETGCFVYSQYDYEDLDEHGKDGLIPLYTHPVKELDEQYEKGFNAGKEEGWKAHKFHHPVKELTDEEIEEVWIQALQDEPKVNVGKFPSLDNQPFVFFARAILKKAQEK